ncbi:MAG: glycosyltransferase family 2 protein [Dorea sp.]|nr:glycosyltransferase family 2 protein [Dorea sp.]
MKYLTITIPSYNSEQYLERCLDSLILPRGWMEHIEIIVVNDGSTDRTGEIADDYVRRFPDTVRVVHKENGGHGSGVNTGLALATGRYFKVLDSDDWLDEGAYRKLVERIETWCIREREGDGDVCPDLLICNYTYNHLDEGTKKTMRYGNVFPEDRIVTWDDIGSFRPSQYLIMHALIYRTEVLRSSGLVLPEHTFYVDNIFAYQPLPFVETLYYMNLELYQYYIGREDQSVNEQMLIRRIGQQIKVTKIVAECVDLNEVRQSHPKLAAYMCRNISIMMAISSIHLLLKGDEEARNWYSMLWEEIKEKSPGLYWRLRFTKLCGLTNLPGKLGKKAAIDGYRLAKRIYKFQ